MATDYKEIIDKLNILIKLIALDKVTTLKTKKEKIIALYQFGLNNNEIAEILDFKLNQVSVEISDYKRQLKEEAK